MGDEPGKFEGVRLAATDYDGDGDAVPSSSLCQCRICHEEELLVSTSMESPCGCTGTLKFAHRKCVQRWCDEKNSTLCEICLQNFEPGYTVPPKKALVEVAVTIRGSVEVPRINYEPQNLEYIGDLHYTECSSSAERSATICRSGAIIFTVILLVRHFIAVVSPGAEQYPFSSLTMLLLRSCGILLPFFLVLHLISSFQKSQRRYRLQMIEGRNNQSLRFLVQDHALQREAIPV